MRVPRALPITLALTLCAAFAGCAGVASPPRSQTSPPDVLSVPPSEAEAPATPSPSGMPSPAAPTVPPRVVVSYYHRTIRCETCLKFETLTDRVLSEAFPDELASGRLTWRVMDFEQPGHESDVARYDIIESSLVVSRYVEDAEVDWKKLDAIWNLVGDEGLFSGYVRGEVAAFLEGDLEPVRAEAGAGER